MLFLLASNERDLEELKKRQPVRNLSTDRQACPFYMNSGRKTACPAASWEDYTDDTFGVSASSIMEPL